ncbi:rhomboid family intramembrane serine protease [Bacteroides sedimenti]|uniref:Rhomboid family intramembrane serine protease n=1 Tax=Bacteroides sedimenti TaxID=2136147 RepID=A0ABM8ID55_9BACE
MEHIITDLRNSFKRGNIAIQLIYINAAVYIITSLFLILLTLFNRSGGSILLYGEFPASLENFLHQPWSLFTYMFMHADILHILFNMLWLFWFGQLFLSFFSAKHLRGLYLLGGICGAALYMLSFNLFPYFSKVVEGSYMLGASASVLAIVVATAYRQPEYQVRLLLFGAIRLKYIALIMILSDLLFITSDNAGGHIAHLGGALAGLWFAASLKKGHDVTAWINRILDLFVNLFSGSVFKSARKPKMTVHYNKNKRSADYDYNAQKKAQSDEVDRILDKLKKSGYDSLTNEEKKRLFDASKR